MPAPSIPASRYTSKEWKQLEDERLWPRVWQLACSVDCVRDPGDYFVYELGRLSIIILRDQTGSLQAFQNTCSHRGSLLLEGAGRGLDEIRCPYHHWCYDFDGHRRAENASAGSAGTPSAASLVPVAVETWGGLVFLNPAPKCAESLSGFLESLPEELAWVGMEDGTCEAFLSVPVACNWKLVIDAFIETYHLHAVHPQMLAIADDVNTPITLYDKHSMFMQPYGAPSPRRGGDVSNQEVWEEFVRNLGHRIGLPFAATENPGPHPEIPKDKTMRDVLAGKIRTHLNARSDRYANLDDHHLIDDFHYHLFPNTVINIFAGWFGVIRARPGKNPDECILDMWNFDIDAHDEARTRPRPVAQQLTLDEAAALGPVLRQDLELLPRVQRGLEQPGARDLRLTPAESRIGRMHEVLDRVIDPPDGFRLG
ncbi:MAG: aromatic ring-hydroxylating dioxygenase subunit alpha [Myxococcota bacterium]